MTAVADLPVDVDVSATATARQTARIRFVRLAELPEAASERTAHRAPGSHTLRTFAAGAPMTHRTLTAALAALL